MGLADHSDCDAEPAGGLAVMRSASSASGYVEIDATRPPSPAASRRARSKPSLRRGRRRRRSLGSSRGTGARDYGLA
jgi:hypothetical protein